MADVFISYKSERRPAVEHLKRVLENYGYSAWFDYGLLSGQPFGRLIEREIRSARAVVVLWCNFSITSRWVLEEASLAEELSSLVPSRIERVSLPFGYRSLDTIDLASWDGNPRSGAALDRLLRQIAIKVGRSPEPNFDALAEQEAQWQIHRKSLADFPLDVSAERLDEERDRQKAEASREAEEALKREAERQREIALQAERDRVAEEARRLDQLCQQEKEERAKKAAKEAEAARIAEAARQREIDRMEQERRRKEELDRRAETKRLADERRNQRLAERQAFFARIGARLERLRDKALARKNWIAGAVGMTAIVAGGVIYLPSLDQPKEVPSSPEPVEAQEAQAAATPVPAPSLSREQLAEAAILGDWALAGLTCAEKVTFSKANDGLTVTFAEETSAVTIQPSDNSTAEVTFKAENGSQYRLDRSRTLSRLIGKDSIGMTRCDG